MPQSAAAAGAPGVPSAPAAHPTIAPPASPSPPLPERISRLVDLSQNLWWSWQLDARELFHRIDHRLWEATRHNAVEFLRQVDPERLEHRAKDRAFLDQYDRVLHRFGLLSRKDDTWFASRYPELLH